jgi:hypothetical protein
VARAAPHESLDPDLEVVDDGRLVERGADFRQRNVERRLSLGLFDCGGAASTLAVTLLAPALWHGAVVTVTETGVKGV